MDYNWRLTFCACANVDDEAKQTGEPLALPSVRDACCDIYEKFAAGKTELSSEHLALLPPTFHALGPEELTPISTHHVPFHEPRDIWDKCFCGEHWPPGIVGRSEWTPRVDYHNIRLVCYKSAEEETRVLEYQSAWMTQDLAQIRIVAFVLDARDGDKYQVEHLVDIFAAPMIEDHGGGSIVRHSLGLCLRSPLPRKLQRDIVTRERKRRVDLIDGFKAILSDDDDEKRRRIQDFRNHPGLSPRTPSTPSCHLAEIHPKSPSTTKSPVGSRLLSWAASKSPRKRWKRQTREGHNQSPTKKTRPPEGPSDPRCVLS